MLSIGISWPQIHATAGSFVNFANNYRLASLCSDIIMLETAFFVYLHKRRTLWFSCTL